MTMKKRGRKALAGLVAAGAALALALSGASIATAVDGQADSPLILPGEAGEPITGTVTVHKHEQGDEAGSAANGLPQDVTSPTIAEVEFTAKQVMSFNAAGETYSLDLTTNTGWENAAKLSYNAAADTWAFEGAAATPVFGTDIERNTGAAGSYAAAVFADIPVGLYHFAETDHPANVTPSAPWVMSVPLTHPTELDSWLYDINVYPKNSTTAITKTVQDADGIKIGDAVNWTIRGDIPRTANPEFDAQEETSLENLEFLAPSRYTITDQLDGRLALTSVEVSLVDSAGDPLGAPALVAGDYTVMPNPIPGIGLNRGQNVVVDFTPAGRAKLGLVGSTTGAQVQVLVGTNVAALLSAPAVDGEEEGVVQNQAFLFPNDSTVDGIPSDVPVSKWGDVLIRKVDASNTSNPLEGAVFSVFTSKEEAELGDNPIAFGSGGTTTFTTNEQGEVRISGLRYSGWADGVELNPTDDRYRTYWLVEVTSPDGFELLAEPIEVVVDAAGAEVTVKQIENAPHNAGFELPLTGGMGTAILTILGAGLLAAVVVVARRRRNEEIAE